MEGKRRVCFSLRAQKVARSWKARETPVKEKKRAVEIIKEIPIFGSSHPLGAPGCAKMADGPEGKEKR